MLKLKKQQANKTHTKRQTKTKHTKKTQHKEVKLIREECGSPQETREEGYQKIMTP